MKYIISVFLLSGACLFAGAKEMVIESLEVKAQFIREHIELDGILKEAVWNNGFGIAQFTQRDPLEGALPTEKTEVWVAYDDEALYIGARLYDSCPDSISARLGRRDDWTQTDMFCVFIDPYFDKRSGYYFALSAAGTKCDGILNNDEWDDDSWDGVWEGYTYIGDHGWNAEICIPFSQLRFKPQDKYVWGINFRRDISRKNEKVYLVYTPKNGSGFVSRFPELTGIENISTPNSIEILPYTNAKAEFTNPDNDDPFNDGSDFSPGMGLDFKIGLSSNLTLNGTINPDFGQVEVDPAVVNLSDVETYFSEKRPFFIEGASIFEFGYGGSRSHWSFNWSNPTFFYSRRIGRAPQGNLPDNDFADVPDGTKILGAGKLTGKLGDNWNLGVLHAVTAREFGKTQYNGVQSELEIEPITHYTVGRLQKEIDNGFQGIGIIGASTIRSFEDDRLRDDLNSRAFSLGLDGWSFLDKNKTWVISTWAGMSNVNGNKQRIIDLQRNSTHYFQRPDASVVSVDSQATSMSGLAGRILLNKQKGSMFLNSAIGIVSPGFDINDLGYMWRTNIINSHFGIGYKWTEPGEIFRYREIIGAGFYTSDFDGNMTWGGFWGSTFMRFLNYYELQITGAYNPETNNITKTRGGPIVLNPPGAEIYTYATSDARKAVVISVEGNTYYQTKNDWYSSADLSITWKPLSNINFSISPAMEWNREFAQWAETDPIKDPTAVQTFGYRYIFAGMDQKTFSAGVRLDWTFTPKLSFQLYMQPLISAADYYDYKELIHPKSYDFRLLDHGNSTLMEENDQIVFDHDGQAATEPVTWDNPDFNITSLRGNAVLRWEYRPGSAIYLVWTQSRFEENETHQFQMRKSLSDIVHSKADNIFMLKINYWLNL
ncbi:MAG: carbohydrate binding family 9 domain-containing protein [Calditrichaceae bacterium]|nr:carbohydrate binding family 9 domain-containing protein [Calditrichaceae bacterium]RQV93895.1 MAG: hypothetical protein EH224_11765 [Calditrichota bacterium]